MRWSERRQLQLICNHYHSRIMRCMMLIMLFAILLFGGGFLAIFSLLASWPEDIIPLDLIQRRINQVLLVLITLVPLVFTVLWYSGWWLTYHTVGPLERITLALQRCIETQDYSAIRIRKEDRIAGLVTGINSLLAGARKTSGEK